VTVTIVGEAATLLAPKVDEAPSGQLDAGISSATVRILANPIFAPGDVITLIWSGTRADGSALLYQTTRNFTGGMIGNDVLIPVPGSEIAPLAGGTLQVSYTVQHGDGTTLPPSGVLMLVVGTGTGVLLPPTVDEAPDNTTLDPDNVNLQATVRIQPYDDMAVGDRIDMYWVGGSGDSYHDWTIVSIITNGRPITFPVDKDPYVNDNDGNTVTISYTVTNASGVQNSTPLMLQVGEAQENPAQPGTNPHIAVTEADPLTQTLNVIYEDDITKGVHVVINDDDMKVGDTVTMIWQGTQGSGTQWQPATVTTLGHITFTVSLTVIRPNYNSTVQIGYTVQHKGDEEPDDPTQWYDLLIQRPNFFGDLLVMVSANTAKYICNLPTNITIADNLPVNYVIATASTGYPDVRFTATTSKGATSVWVYSSFGSQPKDDSTLFPTSIPGVAFRFRYDFGDGEGLMLLPGGPWQLDEGKEWTSSGTSCVVEIVKTGPITAGGTIKATEALFIGHGVYNSQIGYFVIPKNVTIKVLKSRSPEI
jgi:hypothetical protein